MKKCNKAKIFGKLNLEILYKIPNLFFQSSIIILKRTSIKGTLVPMFSVKQALLQFPTKYILLLNLVYNQAAQIII